jgi:hypothetical protein
MDSWLSGPGPISVDCITQAAQQQWHQHQHQQQSNINHIGNKEVLSGG